MHLKEIHPFVKHKSRMRRTKKAPDRKVMNGPEPEMDVMDWSPQETGWMGHDGRFHFVVREAPSGIWLAICNSRGGHFLGKFETPDEARIACEAMSLAWIEVDAEFDLI